MPDKQRQDDLDLVRDALMPVLANASVGEFDASLRIDPVNPKRVNELLMGIQVLLDVIAEQVQELEVAKAKLERTNGELAESRDRSLAMLDEVLRKSLE